MQNHDVNFLGMFLDEPISREQESERAADLAAQVAPYKIIVSDDDTEVHNVTEILLKRVQFEGRSLAFFHAYNEAQTKALLWEHGDAAILFQDVVMDTKKSGLDLVHFVRTELKNRKIRIILRTGNPGDAPERRIVIDYDINDYKLKTELTHQQLLTSVYQALRSYRDLTIIEEKSLELERMLALTNLQNQQLKSQNEMLIFKDHIFSIVGHDLRAPLSSIITSLAMVDDDASTYDYLVKKGTFKRLGSVAKGSLDLLEDLLLWSKTQMGVVPYAPVAFGLHEIMRELVPLYRSLAAEKQIELIYSPQTAEAINIQVMADPKLLSTVMRNVLSNALKFTNRSGRIEILISQDQQNAIVEVRDNGVGIPQEKLDQLFIPNQTTHSHGTEGEKGTGFGLALSKGLIEKNNGSLEVYSVLGEGTKVIIKFSKK